MYAFCVVGGAKHARVVAEDVKFKQQGVGFRGIATDTDGLN